MLGILLSTPAIHAATFYDFVESSTTDVLARISLDGVEPWDHSDILSPVFTPAGNVKLSLGLGLYGGVFDTTGNPKNPSTLVFRDLLIDHSITDSNLNFTFTANPVSGKEFVVVKFHRNSIEFANVIQELTDTQPVQAKGLLATELPPFTATREARNRSRSALRWGGA